MALDDFGEGSRSSSGGGGGGGRQNTKLDFSRPYIMVIRDQEQQVTADVGPARILRPEDDPNTDYEVLCRFSDKRSWRSFSSSIEEEFGLDADEVLENNPEKIPELKSNLPKPDPPSPTRTCVVCGEQMNPASSSFTELKLARDGQANSGADKTPVHEHHTIEELVNANKD